MNIVLKILIIVVLVIVAIYFLLPNVLHLLGLHPKYEKNAYDMSGKKALIVTTSHGVLGDSGKETGVYASEMTIPYYEFKDVKMAVDVASINGGSIPVDPMSVKWPMMTKEDKRYLKDNEFLSKTTNSLKIDDINFAEYDFIFIAGGWGAAYDLGQSEVLGNKISQAYVENTVIGAVCHGALGLINAVDENGNVLIEGMKMTAVTNKQLGELGITMTPLHPETELRGRGANYVSDSRFKDTLATLVVVDGNIVTGQNQNSGGETAQKMMEIAE